MNKKCTKCRNTKDLSEFYKDITRKDNLRNNCKKCSNKYNDARRAKRKKKQPRVISVTFTISLDKKVDFNQEEVPYIRRCVLEKFDMMMKDEFDDKEYLND